MAHYEYNLTYILVYVKILIGCTYKTEIMTKFDKNIYNVI